MAAEVRVHRAAVTSALYARARVHRIQASAAGVTARVYACTAAAQPPGATVRVYRLAVTGEAGVVEEAILQRRGGQWVARQVLTRVDGAWL